MESQWSLLSNEQARSNNNNTTVYINDQQPNDPLSSEAEPHFSSNTNSALDPFPINALIDFHKKQTRNSIKYMFIIFGIVALIGLVLLFASYALPKCINDLDKCSTRNVLFIVFGSGSLGAGILLSLITACCGIREMKKQFNDLNINESGQQPIIWRMDGEEWIRYLNYIYGPDRQWIEMDPLSCFCCRRLSYHRLMHREYGYIVLYGNGLIIDELYFISFRAYTLQGIQLLSIDEHQQIIGLRIHTYLKAGKYSRQCYFDVIAPSSVSVEQLQTIAQSYNGKIEGFNALDMTMGGLYLTAAVLYALS